MVCAPVRAAVLEPHVIYCVWQLGYSLSYFDVRRPDDPRASDALEGYSHRFALLPVRYDCHCASDGTSEQRIGLCFSVRSKSTSCASACDDDHDRPDKQRRTAAPLHGGDLRPLLTFFGMTVGSGTLLPPCTSRAPPGGRTKFSILTALISLFAAQSGQGL